MGRAGWQLLGVLLGQLTVFSQRLFEQFSFVT
jgi:hypothetical protein